MAYFWQRGDVTLRPAHPSDWVYFYENYFESEARFLYYTETEPPIDRQTAKSRYTRFLKNSAKRGRQSYTVVANGDRVVGSLDLYDMDSRNGTFQVASFICEPERGRGYAMTAMQILLDYCFFELRLHKYNARILSTNTASIRLHSRLGCKKEGVMRHMFYHGGEYRDLEWWGMTEDEYRSFSQR